LAVVQNSLSQRCQSEPRPRSTDQPLATPHGDRNSSRLAQRFHSAGAPVQRRSVPLASAVNVNPLAEKPEEEEEEPERHALVAGRRTPTAPAAAASPPLPSEGLGPTPNPRGTPTRTRASGPPSAFAAHARRRLSLV
jgi:hypothetical protein